MRDQRRPEGAQWYGREGSGVSSRRGPTVDLSTMRSTIDQPIPTIMAKSTSDLPPSFGVPVPERFRLGVDASRLVPEALQEAGRAYRSRPNTPRLRSAWEDNVRVRWNLHTNVIEGSMLLYGQAAIILLGPEATGNEELIHISREQDVYELIGHDAAVRNLQRHMASGAVLGVEELRAWHRDLLPLHSERGHWKSRPNGVRALDGRIHVFAPPEVVPSAIKQHMKAMDAGLRACERGDEDITTVLARLHIEYLALHPFADGNGRTGRLLLSWLCLRAGYPVPIVPSDAREVYIEAMGMGMKHDDPLPLRTLLAACLTHEVDFAIAAAEGHCDPTFRNAAADSNLPPGAGGPLFPKGLRRALRGPIPLTAAEWEAKIGSRVA